MKTSFPFFTVSDSTDIKLDIIISHLERMDRRDRLRTVGGFFRGLIGLIPIILILWSSWYFYTHSDELLDTITKKAAEQAAGMTGEDSELMKRLEQYLPKQ